MLSAPALRCCLIALPPCGQGIQDGLQAHAQFRQGILHARRHFGEHLSVHEASFFHGAQIGGQHFLGDGAHGALQLFEAHGAVRQQVAKDEDLPFVADEEQRGLHGAGGEVLESALGHFDVLLFTLFRFNGY